MVTNVYESGYSIGDPIYAEIGGAWASHPGTCAIVKTVNGAAPVTVAMSGCGAQTVQVGTMMRLAKEYTVAVRATSVDGTRTADSATETYYAEGTGSCYSAPASFVPEAGLPPGFLALELTSAPALPPCDCGGTTGRICPVNPVATPTGDSGRPALRLGRHALRWRGAAAHPAPARPGTPRRGSRPDQPPRGIPIRTRASRRPTTMTTTAGAAPMTEAEVAAFRQLHSQVVDAVEGAVHGKRAVSSWS